MFVTASAFEPALIFYLAQDSIICDILFLKKFKISVDKSARR